MFSLLALTVPRRVSWTVACARLSHRLFRLASVFSSLRWHTVAQAFHDPLLVVGPLELDQKTGRPGLSPRERRRQVVAILTTAPGILQSAPALCRERLYGACWDARHFRVGFGNACHGLTNAGVGDDSGGGPQVAPRAQDRPPWSLPVHGGPLLSWSGRRDSNPRRSAWEPALKAA